MTRALSANDPARNSFDGESKKHSTNKFLLENIRLNRNF